MVPKYEVRKAILRELMAADGVVAINAEKALTKFGEGFQAVLEELTREGRVKFNYTTTQGVASALYYVNLTQIGRIYAEEALRDITINRNDNPIEAITKAIEASTAKPVVLVFDDGSIARINGTTYSDALVALFTASIKQVKP